MFISNAISVFLIGWPLMPLAIRGLGWWLQPPAHSYRRDNLLGLLILASLFILEIAIFWNFI
jgi:hypothetical protein